MLKRCDKNKIADNEWACVPAVNIEQAMMYDMMDENEGRIDLSYLNNQVISKILFDYKRGKNLTELTDEQELNP